MAETPNISIEGTQFGGDFVTGDKNSTNIAQQVQGDLNTESNEVTQNINEGNPFDPVREACETDQQKECVDKLEGYAEAGLEGATDNQKEVVGGLLAEFKSALTGEVAQKVPKLLLEAAEAMGPAPVGLLASLAKKAFFPNTP